jgi:hypothetical protein
VTTSHPKRGTNDKDMPKLDNQMICALKRHKDKIEKVQFHSNELVVSIDL